MRALCGVRVLQFVPFQPVHWPHSCKPSYAADVLASAGDKPTEAESAQALVDGFHIAWIGCAVFLAAGAVLPAMAAPQVSLGLTDNAHGNVTSSTSDRSACSLDFTRIAGATK